MGSGKYTAASAIGQGRRRTSSGSSHKCGGLLITSDIRSLRKRVLVALNPPLSATQS